MTERVGVVTTSYPRWPGDPAGSFVAGHVGWLTRRGAAVTVVAAGEPGTAAAPDGPAAPGAARVVRVPDSMGLFYRGGAPERLEAGAVTGTVAAARFTAALAAAIRRERDGWDAVACHWLAPSAAVAAPLTRGPLLAIAHSGDVHVLARRGLLGATVAALLARRARLVFVAPELKYRAAAAVPAALRGRLDDASLVHPMGLALERFTAVARRRAGRPPHDPPRLLAVGRLVPVKGLDVLLDALDRLQTPVVLTLAGDGPERAALEARAAAAPRRHVVRLVGEVGPDRRDALLEEADVFVAPSVVLPGGRTEGTPTAVLEAVASGLPVVASAVGGLAGLPEGWLTTVPERSPAALAAALAAVLADPAAGRRAAAAADAARVLDWRVVGRRLDAHWHAA